MLSSRYTAIFNEQQTKNLQEVARQRGVKVQDLLREFADSLNLSPDCVGDEPEQPKGLKPGDRLDTKDTDFERKLERKHGLSTYAYFPALRVITIKRRSSNWARTWWEVVETFNPETESEWWDSWHEEKTFEAASKEHPILTAIARIAPAAKLDSLKMQIATASRPKHWLETATKLWAELSVGTV